jgi:hypothetical protein
VSYIEDTTPMKITRGQKGHILKAIDGYKAKYEGSTKLLDDLHHLESLVYAFVRPVVK